MILRAPILVSALSLVAVAHGGVVEDVCPAACYRSVFVNEVTFRDATLEEVVRELHKPERLVNETFGLNIIALPGAGEGRRISGHWEKAKVKYVIDEIAKQGNVSVRMDPYAFVFVPRSDGPSQTPATTKRVTGEPTPAAAKAVIRGSYFRDATVSEIVEYLNRKAAELGEPVRPAVFEVQCKRVGNLPPVTFALWNVPISEVVCYVAECTGMRVEWNYRGAVLKCGE
jgi:hypothetical protein